MRRVTTQHTFETGDGLTLLFQLIAKDLASTVERGNGYRWVLCLLRLLPELFAKLLPPASLS